MILLGFNELQDKHTFVIPVYNKSPYLEACIYSLLKQTIKTNIILCSSTPSVFLKKISEKYKLTLIINHEKKGIANDWSFAYHACKTKYLTLAHQDDIYEEDYTLKCLNAMEKNNCLIVFTDYLEADKQGTRKLSLTLAVKKLILRLFFFIQPLFDFNFHEKKAALHGLPCLLSKCHVQ